MPPRGSAQPVAGERAARLARPICRLYSRRVAFRYIAIEGPIGVGKTRWPSGWRARLDATRRARGHRQSVPRRLLRRPPRRGAAGAALLSAQSPPPADDAAAGRPLQQTIVCDYLFDKDKIFAYLNLDDNELFIYQRLYDLLAPDVPPPDLVHLPAGADRRARARASRAARTDPDGDAAAPDADYLRELNEAYQHFFFHYTATPLLVVETSQFDLTASDEALDD